MSDIPILPNPFKMLDLERAKRTNPKCNSCEEEVKKEGFNNLKKGKPITEGMGVSPVGNKGIAVLIAMSIIAFIARIFLLQMDRYIIKAPFDTNNALHYLVYLLVFVGFAYIPALFRNENTHNYSKLNRIDNNLGSPYLWVPTVVGVLMSLLYLLPMFFGITGLIHYLESTVGHFMFWISTLKDDGLNKWIRSENFEALTTKNDTVTNNFNPLMSIFNFENFHDKIAGMRMGNTNTGNNEDTNNSSDFFVSLQHTDGEKTDSEFIKYIKDKVIIKRASGEVTLLAITTLISTGIIKSIYR